MAPKIVKASAASALVVLAIVAVTYSTTLFISSKQVAEQTTSAGASAHIVKPLIIGVR